MGWSGGTDPMRRIIKVIKKNVPDKEARAIIYDEVIDAFEDQDWDTQDECLGIDKLFDKVLKERNPELYEDDE
jgi:hypothetical protein